MTRENGNTGKDSHIMESINMDIQREIAGSVVFKGWNGGTGDLSLLLTDATRTLPDENGVLRQDSQIRDW